MTKNEFKVINEVIASIKSECDTLEELFLQTKAINLRWVKQSLEEKAVTKLKSLLK